MREDNFDVVLASWSKPVIGSTSIDIWQNKIRRLRQDLKGWNINVLGFYKKVKQELLSVIDNLDKKCEQFGLNIEDRFLKQTCKAQLHTLLREEELKWYQRSKEKDLLEGDNNTKYFQLKASGRN